MAELVYILCAVTSIGCAILLLRGYVQSRARLLLYCGLCFAGLAINNVLLFVDLVIVQQVDLSLIRNASALVAMVILLTGLVGESQ